MSSRAEYMKDYMRKNRKDDKEELKRLIEEQRTEIIFEINKEPDVSKKEELRKEFNLDEINSMLRGRNG